MIHLLLQYLPGIAAPERRDAALRFLSARAARLDAIARESLAEEALKVIGLPELAGLFGPGSMAEVPVMGRVAAGRRIIDVNGQVDRIGEAAGAVTIADFKTGSPRALAGELATYVTQMALYRAALAPLWPNKSLRMLLIWTEGPLAVSLSGEKLDAALVALSAAE